MKDLTTIDYLINTLPKDSWPWLISAIRNDRTVWNELEDPNFLNLALNRLGGQPKLWTPLNLALICIDDTISFNYPENLFKADHYPEIIVKSEQTYKNLQEEILDDLNLEQAGLLAIYHLQEPKLSKQIASGTLYACIFSLVDDKAGYLTQIDYKLAAHAILSNPLDPTDLRIILSRLIASYINLNQIAALRYFSLIWPEIVSELILELIGNIPPDNSIYQKRSADSTYTNIGIVLNEIEFFDLSHQNSVLQSKINAGLNYLEEIKNSLVIRLIKILLTKGELEQAHQIWEKSFLSFCDAQVSDFILYLEDIGCAENLEKWIQEGFVDIVVASENFIHMLSGCVYYYHQGNKNLVLSVLDKAVKNLDSFDFDRPMPLLIAARLYFKLGAFDKSIMVLETILTHFPNHYETLSLLLENYHEKKDYFNEITVARLMVVLNPMDLAVHRKLAQGKCNNMEWTGAVYEYSEIIDKQENPLIDDLYHLAECANLADIPQQAASVCQRILLSNPEDFIAHRILGEAYVALGDPQKAQKQFERSIEVSATSLRAWLGLAQLYEQKNEFEKCKEILQTASQANPSAPEINIALGKVFLNQKALTKALVLFQTAKKHYENREQDNKEDDVYSEILENLGITQLKLGFHNDAIQTLEYGYSLYPQKIGIAHNYAKCLLERNQVNRAKQILTEIRKQEPENFEILLDYATVCLTGIQDPIDAEQSLLLALDLNPQSLHAKALLAETFEINKKFDEAYDLYKDVLNSSLSTDPYWYTRLSLGMSRVSIAQKDPGTAIAILKDALIGNKEDLRILKSLSNAYMAAELKDKSLSVAKLALSIAPKDESNLEWYIDQTVKLDAIDEAIEILEQSLEDKPERPKLLNKLAWLYETIGDFNAASETFQKITTLEQISATDLLNTSQGFLAIGEPGNAIECIDKAINLEETPEKENLLHKLVWTKSLIQKEHGSLVDALATIESSVFDEFRNPEIIDLKTRILCELNRINESKECINEGINSFPDNLKLRLLATSIYRLADEPETARIHAEHILDISSMANLNSYDMLTSGVLSDYFFSMLQTELAKDIVEHTDISVINSPPAVSLSYYCLKAELALYAEEEVAAADALTSAVKIDPNHPRVLALQAYITSRQGDIETAKKIFDQSLNSVKNYSYLDESDICLICKDQEIPFVDTASTFISLAETSIILHEWGVTTYLLQRALHIASKEPRSHHAYARAIVIRAEFQRLCDLLDVETHAPGESSIAEYAYRQFEGSILQAAQYIIPLIPETKSTQTEKLYQKLKISTWLARGQAVFKPSIEHANAINKLDQSPDNLAAYIASLLLCSNRKIAEQIASDILNHPEKNIQLTDTKLLAQISLAVAVTSPDEALRQIQKAIQLGTKQNKIYLPILHIIQAFIAKEKNNKNLETKAFQTALSIWPDEPRWLSRAANLLIDGSDQDISIAIRYLENASRLEPKVVDHSLDLSEAYLKIKNIKKAIIVLENATQENSNDASLWLVLAKVYYSDQDIPQTIRCAKNAILLDSKLIDAHFLLADVAMELNNPRAALKYLEEVLKSQPDNSQALLLEYKAYDALKQPENALYSLDKLIPHQPESIPFQIERIKLIAQIRGAEQALKEIYELSAKYPNNTKISLAIVEIIANSGDHENATNLARRILTTSKDDLDSTELSNLLELLGRSLRKSGHLDQAIYYLTEAVNVSPQRSTTHVELGRCYQNRRQLDQALSHFQEAISLEPDSAQNYYLAGMILKEIKDFENAEIMFKKASKISPRDLNIHRQLAAVTAINIVANHPDSSMMEMKF